MKTALPGRATVKLVEIHPSCESGPNNITGELIRVAHGVAYVRHDPRSPRWPPWVIPLSLRTGRPCDGTDWAWCADPAELERAAKDLR